RHSACRPYPVWTATNRSPGHVDYQPGRPTRDSLPRDTGLTMWPFKKKTEKRNYTQMMMDARYMHIHGRRGVGELSATVQSCIALWEAGLSLADVEGTDVLTARHRAM